MTRELLRLLQHGPRTMAQLEAHGLFDARLYDALDAALEAGLIQVRGWGSVDRTSYRLTKAGRGLVKVACVQSWCGAGESLDNLV